MIVPNVQKKNPKSGLATSTVLITIFNVVLFVSAAYLYANSKGKEDVDTRSNSMLAVPSISAVNNIGKGVPVASNLDEAMAPTV